MKREKLQIVSNNKGDIFLCVIDILEELSKIQLKDQSKGIDIISLTFFINATDVDFYSVREFIFSKLELMFPHLPATSVVGQAPDQNFKIVLEADICYDFPVNYKIEYLKFENQIYISKIESSTAIEYYIFGMTIADKKITINKKIIGSFEILENCLKSFGLGMNNIVRQWNYLENILGYNSQLEANLQNYQLLNNVRHQFYDKYRFTDGYPAATGIGMSAGGFVLDCIVIQEKMNMEIIPVYNPVQTSAYNYSDKVLLGPVIPKYGPNMSPKFERAKLIHIDKNRYSLLISGTAAILSEESMAKNDAHEQTKITLGNIDRLIETSSKILRESGNQIDSVWFNYMRVYIKNSEDTDSIKSLCNNYIQNVKPVYLIADICREELLVEIEAEVAIYIT